MTTRRQFVDGAMCAALAGTLPFGGLAGAAGGPDLTVGILSDIHIDGAEPSGKTAAFERALRHFRETGVDAVLLAGDLTEHGLVSELGNVARSWSVVFPDDRLPDGRKIVKLFVYGDHDSSFWHVKSAYWGGHWEGAERARKWEDSIARAPAAAWEKCFHETFSPFYVKRVKGYPFLCAHWRDDGRGHAVSDIPGAPEFVRREGSTCDAARPFFYVQHRHPKGTCFGDWVTADGGAVTPALADFPNAVAVSGHAHQPLSDERNVWQGAFTSVGTATLDYVGGRHYAENLQPFVLGTSRAAPMPRLDMTQCTQGMVMRVHRDRIDFERLDFEWGLSMGADWSVPWPTSRGKPYAPEAQARRFGAPEFPAGAAIAIREADGLTADGQPMRRVIASFPAANAGAMRVYRYEVSAVLVEEDLELPVLSKMILSPDHHLPPAKTGLPAEMHFAFSELPVDAHIRFDVTPVSCFGGRGRTLRSADRWIRKGEQQ